MKKLVLVVALLFIPFVNAETFPPQRQNTGFVGYFEEYSEAIEYRLTYPSVEDGENANMAQNGPFAIVVFCPDNGESIEQYLWLQEGLSRHGFISLVVEDSRFDWNNILELLQKFNNGTISTVSGSTGMFSLPHVAIGGHGTGAFSAAEIYKTGLFAIDGLFGIALDGDESEVESTNQLSRPASALFLTGTTDDIAPATENVMSYVEDWPGAWQIMHVLGANHIGYQESDSFFERLADGDSTMGKEEQQNHALKHILPYLNLTLRGDDSAYQEAFNRETKSSSSDPDSYIDEDLTLSRLYSITNAGLSNNYLTVNKSFDVTADVTMRNGGMANGNVTCLLPDGLEVEGNLSSGVAKCELNSSNFPIGSSYVSINVHDYSFSDYERVLVTRIGTPMVEVVPIPEVIFDQHGNVTIFPSDFAIDPDGKEVLFYSADITNDTGIVGIENFGSEMKFTHLEEQEWDGTMTLNLNLTAGSEDFMTITTNLTILPVNDPVFQTANVPQQQTIEDGESIIFDISDYVSDPENQPLFFEFAVPYDGLRVSGNNSIVIIDPQPHWYGVELVRLNVWDNVTEKIEVSVPVNVVSVNDPVEFLKSSASIEMNEDSTLTIDFSEYSIDVDNEVLVYNIVGELSLITYSLNGDVLTIYGNDDAFGSQSFTVTVEDASSNDSMEFNLMIMPVADPPIVQISSIDTRYTGVDILWTISDSDGSEGHIQSVTLNGEPIGFITECSGDKYITCLTEYEFTNQTVGYYTVEVKVWDGFANVWSNIAFQNIEIVEPKVVEDNAESGGLDSATIQLIALFLIIVGLIAYLLQSKK